MLIRPCNLDPIEPHFYFVKPRFTGVYIYFALKHSLWVFFKVAITPQSMFSATIKRMSQFFHLKNCHFTAFKIPIYCIGVDDVLGFYVPPTAKVIRRRDLGLKSHPKDWRSPGSNSRPLVYKAGGLTTTPRRLLLHRCVNVMVGFDYSKVAKTT